MLFLALASAASALSLGSVTGAVTGATTQSNPVDGSLGYLVTVADGTPLETVINQIAGLSDSVSQRFTLINAFALKPSASPLVAALSLVPGVTVERDEIFSINAQVTQTNAPWGLQRVSTKSKVQATSGGNEKLPAYKYTYNTDSIGSGVDAYIVDTGVNCDHVSFGGRAVCRPEADFTGSGSSYDGNGHGTHCTGTIGSSSYGVAKAASLFAVRVLGSDGSGSSSQIISGIQYVVAQKKLRKRPTVMSMSLGGIKQVALDNAVNAAIRNGVHAVVAAGNDAAPACLYSPAGSNAITVGATNITDTFAYFSNFGMCVDVLAPGFNVLSAWNGSPVDTKVISGTSMATPHTAGVVARYLSLPQYAAYTPNQIKQLIQQTAQKNAITSVPLLTPNLMVQTPST
ncbi:serine protease [Savitreella phatthalungensis]